MRLGIKNKYGKPKSTSKKSHLGIKLFFTALISVAIVILIYQFGIMDYYEKNMRTQITKEISGSGEYNSAYILNKDIEKGGTITPEDVEMVTRGTDIIPSNQINNLDEFKDKVTRMNLSGNTILTNDMLVDSEQEITDAIKDQDFDWIRVHAFLNIDDFVDIHYKEVDGTDTVVVAKKRIKNLNGNIFSIDISEEERAYINNATVKASVLGGELYTSIYPDSVNQNAAIVTYELDKDVQEKIKNDPNIVRDAAEKLKKDKETEEDSDEENKKDINVDKEVSFSSKSEKPYFVPGGEQ